MSDHIFLHRYVHDDREDAARCTYPNCEKEIYASRKRPVDFDYYFKGKLFNIPGHVGYVRQTDIKWDDLTEDEKKTVCIGE